MVFSIGKQFSFDAAHRGACGRRVESLHGHTFTAEIRVQADQLVAPGFVVDFAEFQPMRGYVSDALDHRLLDDVLDDASIQGIGAHLQDWCRGHVKLPPATDMRVQVWGNGSAPRLPGRGLAVWETTFEAAHQLPDLPPGHKCGRLHGHSYAVGVRTSDDCPAEVLEPLRDHVASQLDYRFLNEMVRQPATSENLAAYLYEWSAAEIRWQGWDLDSVVVSETASTWAEFRA